MNIDTINLGLLLVIAFMQGMIYHQIRRMEVMRLFHVVYERAPLDLDVIYDWRVQTEAKLLCRKLKKQNPEEADKYKVVRANP